jgi:MoxR-like ATPase
VSTPTTSQRVRLASEQAAAVLDRVGSVVIGKTPSLRLVLAGILAGGHVLLEDFPGLGKTLAARSFAQSLGLEFTRAQFTPDLLPADLTGSFIYNQRTGEFEFREGPLFTGLLLADEINRTPPKTQAALLEAMQERQITVEGRTFPLAAPFHVLATANPVEYEGTYPLPEAQLDRFLLRVGFGYPTAEEEYDVLRTRVARRRDQVVLEPVTDAARLSEMQAAVEEVEVDRSVAEYCVALVAASRSHRDVLVGASPRGSLALMLSARALAVISGRDFVLPEDVKAVARSVLVHRVTVKPELWMTETTAESIVESLLATVPTPTAHEPVPETSASGSAAQRRARWNRP